MIKKNRKEYIRVFLVGLGVIFVTIIITTAISIYIFYQNVDIVTKSPVDQIAQQLKHPPGKIVVATTISQLIFIIGGILAGLFGTWRLKKNQILYGALIGLAYDIIFFIIILINLLLVLFFPRLILGSGLSRNGLNVMKVEEISRIIRGLPWVFINILIPFTALGGVISQILSKRRKSRK